MGYCIKSRQYHLCIRRRPTHILVKKCSQSNSWIKVDKISFGTRHSNCLNSPEELKGEQVNWVNRLVHHEYPRVVPEGPVLKCVLWKKEHYFSWMGAFISLQIEIQHEAWNHDCHLVRSRWQISCLREIFLWGSLDMIKLNVIFSPSVYASVSL